MKIELRRYVLMLCPLVMMSGCSESGLTSVEHSSPDQLYIVALDRSASTNPMRSIQLSQLNQIVLQSMLSDSKMEFWTFDRRPLCQWGPDVPVTPHALDAIENKTITESNSELRHITRPALLLRDVASSSAFQNSRNVTLVILTDGDSEGPNDGPLFTKEAAILAKHPGFRLALLDINPENRSRWQTAFKSVPEADVMLTGDTQGTEGLNSFLNNHSN